MWFHTSSVQGGNNKAAKVKKNYNIGIQIRQKKRTVEQAKMWINQCLCGQLVNLMLSDTSQRSRIPVV